MYTRFSTTFEGGDEFLGLSFDVYQRLGEIVLNIMDEKSCRSKKLCAEMLSLSRVRRLVGHLSCVFLLRRTSMSLDHTLG